MDGTFSVILYITLHNHNLVNHLVSPKPNSLDFHMHPSNSNLWQPPCCLGANALPSFAVINVYLFKHTQHKMLTLCHLTYLFTNVANKYSGRLVHAEWLKWSLNFLMRMWYNDLFSSVRVHKYQLCIGSTPLCLFVVPVWKCCCFAGLNMTFCHQWG